MLEHTLPHSDPDASPSHLEELVGAWVAKHGTRGFLGKPNEEGLDPTLPSPSGRRPAGSGLLAVLVHQQSVLLLKLAQRLRPLVDLRLVPEGTLQASRQDALLVGMLGLAAILSPVTRPKPKALGMLRTCFFALKLDKRPSAPCL